MAIRVYDKYDFVGEREVFTTDRLRLGDAQQFAIDHNCTVIIKSFEGVGVQEGFITHGWTRKTCEANTL